jgi:hypothetical protein
MDAEILEALRAAMREDSPSHGLQIVINGPIILGADLGTIQALKLILQALQKSHEPPVLTKAKLV